MPYVTMYEDQIIKRDVARHVSIQANLTNTCPQQCVMCNKPQWAKIQNAAGKNNIDAAVLAGELNSMEFLETVVLSGGDPMNYKDLPKFLDLLDPRFKLGMFTTGLDNAFNRYESLPLERFGYIRFSIDGLKPETWSKIRGTPANRYETAWNNVVQTAGNLYKLYSDSPTPRATAMEKIRVQFTIQSENIEEFPEMVKNCHRYGIPIYGYWVHDYNVVTEYQVDLLRTKLKAINVGPLKEWAKTWTNINSIIDNGDKVPRDLDAAKCIIPLVHAFIDTDGSVFPCCYLVGDNLPFEQRDPKYSYGNIYDRPLNKILSTQNIESVRRQHINNQNDICKACSSNASRYYKMNLEAAELRERRPTFL